jgi:hypothetical protein
MTIDTTKKRTEKYPIKLGWPRLLFIISLGILVFYWLTNGKANFNLLDLWYKFNGFVDKNMAYGGWHRAGVVFLVCSPIIIGVLIKMIRENKQDKESSE